MGALDEAAEAIEQQVEGRGQPRGRILRAWIPRQGHPCRHVPRGHGGEDGEDVIEGRTFHALLPPERGPGRPYPGWKSGSRPDSGFTEARSLSAAELLFPTGLP